MTARLVRALAWLQWRMLVNRLTKSSHRDDIEQMSRWSEVVLRVVLAALMLPAMLLLMVAAVYGGIVAAGDAGDARTVAIAAGFAALLPIVWMLLRPLAMLSAGGIERGVLLRLLPIPASLLRNADVVRAMADPVYLLLAPAVLLLPAGLAVGGRPLLALAAFVAAVAFLALTALLGSLVTLAAQLLLRGRRRAELVTLIFLVVLSTMGIVPQLFLPRGEAHREGTARPAEATASAPPVRAVRDHEEIPELLRPLPPVAYAAVLIDGTTGRWGRTLVDLAWLLAWAAALYLVTIPLYDRLVSVPEGGSGGRAGAARERRLCLPFVAPATAAVAAAELRALLRTVRGKMALLYPALLTVMLAVVFSRGGGGMSRQGMGPLMLGAFAVFGTVAGSGVFAANLFAVQGAGLVLELLLPLGDRRIAAGKLIGVGALVAAGLGLALLPPVLLAPGTSPAVWLAIWLAGIAAFAVASPVAVVLSALFVKPVELSRIGRAGQPNGLASLLYLIASAAAAAPAAGAILLAEHVLAVPWMAAPLVAGYAVLAIAAARAVLPFAVRVVAARRENLALAVVGR